MKDQRRQDFITGLFASHPPSAERLQNNKELAATFDPGGETGRESYQQNLSHLFETAAAYKAYDEAREAASEKDIATAKSLVQRAIRIEPNEGHFHSFLGDIELDANNPRGAIRHYNSAIRANDGFFYYHLQKGLASEAVQDYRAANASLNRSLELLPTANAHNALGNIAKIGGRRDEAIAQYSKAAVHNSPAGQAAMGSLVDLDLSSNPGKYIATRPQISENGTVTVLIQNKTPRNLQGVVLKII